MSRGQIVTVLNDNLSVLGFIQRAMEGGGEVGRRRGYFKSVALNWG